MRFIHLNLININDLKYCKGISTGCGQQLKAIEYLYITTGQVQVFFAINHKYVSWIMDY